MNIFRDALEILNSKKGSEMSEEELKLVTMAIIPLMLNTDDIPDDITIGEGLKELAAIVDQERIRNLENQVKLLTQKKPGGNGRCSSNNSGKAVPRGSD